MVIGQLNIQYEENETKFSRNIIYSERNSDLWITINRKYEGLYAKDRIDGYVLALLLSALYLNEDIESKDSISESLYYQLVHYLIPFLCSINKAFSPIKILCPVMPDNELKGQYTATGISCGVDSLSTIIKHFDENDNSIYNINILTLFNSGYYGGGDESRKNFVRYSTQSIKFAKAAGLELLLVDTNVSDFMLTGFLQTHTFLSCGIALMLQQGIRLYYYSSGYPVYNFKASFVDSAYYDAFTFNCISLPNIKFISSCSTFTRVEKVNSIIQNNEYLEYLYVCTSGFKEKNCGKCEKCIRTLLEADSIGKLKDVSSRFELKEFSRHRNLYIAYAIRRKRKNVYYEEIVDSYKTNHLLPFGAILCIPLPCKFDIDSFVGILVKCKYKLCGFVTKNDQS